jgi:hypothetical protein
MKINSGPATVSSLFNGNTYLTIPSFQRSYSWTSDQIQQFFDDILESANKSESHFYGPVVFLVDDATDKNHFQVIDGQQRMTSVVMLLALLRDAAFGLDDKSVPGKGAAIDVRFRNILFLPDSYEEPRFSASYLLQAVFRTCIVEDPFDSDNRKKDIRKKMTSRGAGMSSAEIVNTRTLRAAYFNLQRRLSVALESHVSEEEKKDFMVSLFKALTTDFEIHSMVLDSEDDAYILFETLNDRGMRLSASDLLKTLTLRDVRTASPQNFDEALNAWDEMVGNLGEYDFSKFLRHYLLTQTDGPVQAGKIFKIFKTMIQSHGAKGAQTNLKRLLKASELYSVLLGITPHVQGDVNDAILRMNSFSETHRVFLLGVLELEPHWSADVLSKLFRATEFLAARWILAGQNAQQLETKYYQKSLGTLRRNPDDETALEIVELFIDAAPQDHLLHSMTYSDSIDMQKYFLRRIDASYGGHGLKWTDPITLEHLAPQTPGSNAKYWEENVCSTTIKDAADSLYDDYVGQWGNLTLLEKPLNSSIRNSTWPNKLVGVNSKYDGLNASTLNLNKPLLAVEHWSDKNIVSRSKWLREISLILIGVDWVRTGKATVSHWTP